jgi:A/G-specific adenine glycosylase
MERQPRAANQASMGRSADSFAFALLAWFTKHGRHDLPWQADRDPYRIWISEIMLQQTQVATVIPYFLRFVTRFRSVQSLADADLDDVLSHWSGLGYYARARNLKRAACVMVDQHGATLPRSFDALTALPGIGRSTAAAILALAWNERQTILDGNVKRVLARYHSVSGWPGASAVANLLWQHADTHTPNERVAEYTQAIMDLGATVCVRGKPLCDRCPVATGCQALASGNAAALPTPRPKKVKPRRQARLALVRTVAGEILLERRPPVGIWGGLLSLPEIADGHDPNAWCRDVLGVTVVGAEALDPIDHSFTHFDLNLMPIQMLAPAQPCAILDDARWIWYDTARPLPGGMAAPIEKLIRGLDRVSGSLAE